MDFLCERVVEILEATLPKILTSINAYKSDEDVAKFGVALTLKTPTFYSGSEANIESTPAVNVYIDDLEAVNQSDCSAGIDSVMLICAIHVDADSTAILKELINRYIVAIRYLLRGNRYLSKIDRSDPLAQSISISFLPPQKFEVKNLKELRYVGIIGIECSLLTTQTEKKYGII